MDLEEEQLILEGEEETQLKEKRPRKKVTLDSHLEKYQLVISLLKDEIERKQKNREPGIRNMQSIKKMVEELEKEVPKVAKIKRKNTNVKKVSGFSLPCVITEELSSFMQISKDATPTRVDITNAICAYSHIKPNETKEQILKWKHLNPGGLRNLQDPTNKMNIIPDARLKKLLKFDAYVKDVKAGKIFKNETNKETGKKEKVQITEPILNYSVIQKLIQSQIVETRRIKKESDFEIVA